MSYSLDDSRQSSVPTTGLGPVVRLVGAAAEGVGPAAQLRGVSKSLTAGGTSIEVLRNVDLTIETGQFFAIIGASGSGKSTILNLLGGLDLPSEGKVEVLGTELTRLSEAERTTFRRDNIGFVFQFYNLLPTLTARENVELALELLAVKPRQCREKAESLLAAVGLSERMNRFPSELSGGEQQRVAIARALAKEPKILLADEPTGNLDRATGRGVIALMRRLSDTSPTTFVVVTHDEEVSEAADVTLQMGASLASALTPRPERK